MAEDDERLRPLADRFRGMKPPRFPTMFEAVINAFACQQLSLEVGLELLNRLAAIAGATFRRPQDIHYAFPTAQDVARLTPAQCRAIGFSHQKVRALLALARAITRGTVDLEVLGQGNDAAVQQALLELRGVGRWTAEYVLLRGLGRFHVFPGDDVGAQAVGPVARAFAADGLRWRAARGQTMAAACRPGVFPPATRWVVPGRRSGLDARGRYA